jgi:hypothetical protein
MLVVVVVLGVVAAHLVLVALAILLTHHQVREIMVALAVVHLLGVAAVGLMLLVLQIALTQEALEETELLHQSLGQA